MKQLLYNKTAKLIVSKNISQSKSVHIQLIPISIHIVFEIAMLKKRNV